MIVSRLRDSHLMCHLCNYILFVLSACCKNIILSSSEHSQDELSALGQYFKITGAVENHNVYKHEGSDKHLAFSAKYGWTVGNVFI